MSRRSGRCWAWTARRWIRSCSLRPRADARPRGTAAWHAVTMLINEISRDATLTLQATAGEDTAVSGRRAAAVRHEVTGTLETVTALRAGGWGSSAAG